MGAQRIRGPHVWKACLELRKTLKNWFSVVGDWDGAITGEESSRWTDSECAMNRGVEVWNRDWGVENLFC